MCVKPRPKYCHATSRDGVGGGAAVSDTARTRRRAIEPEGLDRAVADPHVQRERAQRETVAQT